MHLCLQIIKQITRQKKKKSPKWQWEKKIICLKLIVIKVELKIQNPLPISEFSMHFHASVIKITRILWELQVIRAEDISLSDSELFDGVIGLKKTCEKNFFFFLNSTSIYKFRNSIDESHKTIFLIEKTQ